MRESPPQRLDAESLLGHPAETAWTTRTNPDLTSLLLELGRAVRGLDFYAETDPRRAPLLERACRALQSELTRAGAIDIRLESDGFRLASMTGTIRASGVLQVLAESLARHGLWRIRLDPTLTPTALQGLLELLSQPASRFESTAELARTLAARDITGIQLNELQVPLHEDRPSLTATPPRASASLGSMLLASRPPTAPIALEPESAPPEKPSLEEHPLDAPASDDRGERLRARLIELDRSIEDDAYRQLASDIVVWAENLWSDGLWDECYRALLVLADHSVGFGGRSEPQARTALACFAQLASGDRLDHLIDRACVHVPGSGVRAAQLLLQRGEHVVPALFDRICSSDDETETASLRALVLMLGEASLPTLVAAIDGSDEHRARVGIRLAGELQNADALPALLRALRARTPARRLETIRALAMLPGEDSKEALEMALASDLDEIVVAATEALESCGGSETVPALLDVLEASLHAARTQVSQRLIEALGRMGDERAVPRLASILDRRPLLRRAHWHALQLATVDALARLATREAHRSLERAARSAPGPVRARAADRLEALASR